MLGAGALAEERANELVRDQIAAITDGQAWSRGKTWLEGVRGWVAQSF